MKMNGVIVSLGALYGLATWFFVEHYSTSQAAVWALVFSYVVISIIFIPDFQDASLGEIMMWTIINPVLISAVAMIELISLTGGEIHDVHIALGIALSCVLSMGSLIAFNIYTAKEALSFYLNRK